MRSDLIRRLKDRGVAADKIAALIDLGVDDSLVESMLDREAQTTKAATVAGIRYKGASSMARTSEPDYDQIEAMCNDIDRIYARGGRAASTAAATAARQLVGDIAAGRAVVTKDDRGVRVRYKATARPGLVAGVSAALNLDQPAARPQTTKASRASLIDQALADAGKVR